MSVCEITLIGNVGRDPEMRYLPDGKPVTTINVAVSQGRKQPDGTWSDETDWFRVSVFGPQGERVAERVRKGGKVVVIGHFRSRTYTDKEGTTRVSLEVVASSVVPFDSGAQRGSETGTRDVDVSGLDF